MLGDDEREEEFLERIGLALEFAETVAAAVGIVRREDDEAPVGEAGGEGLVVAKGLAVRVLVR